MIQPKFITYPYRRPEEAGKASYTEANTYGPIQPKPIVNGTIQPSLSPHQYAPAEAYHNERSSRSLSYEPNDPAEADRINSMIQPKPIITNDPAEADRMSRMIQPKPIIKNR